MTDKEYTDVEIIEILEHCCTDELSCESCPAYDAPTKDCNGVNWFDILQLVKRLKAENKRLIDLINELGDYNEAWVKDNHDLRVELKTTKSDAIREFAERLFERVAVKTLVGKSEDYSDGFIEATCWYDEEIDNLVKEMTEETP